jgi:rRNA maturation endonuclease Nob1
MEKFKVYGLDLNGNQTVIREGYRCSKCKRHLLFTTTKKCPECGRDLNKIKNED